MSHKAGVVGRGAQLLGGGLAWLLGVAAQLQQAALWPLQRYAVLMACGLLALWAAWRWPRAWLLAWVGAALVGLGAAGWQASERLHDALPAALEGQDVWLTGVVSGLPQQGPSGVRFRFEVGSAHRPAPADEAGGAGHDGEPVAVPRHLSLAWYAGFGEEASASGPQRAVRAGQSWRLRVRLKAVHGNANPHGFDYELYLFEQGVRATGYVRADAQHAPRLIDPAAGHVLARLRQSVVDGIAAQVSNPRAAGVLAALAVGDQSAIDRDDWQVFRSTGVAHLMSISGLHVTMFAWLAGLGVAALWRRSARAMLRLPVAQAARWGGLMAALGYALLAGWGVPAQRTVWMLATVTLLQALGRRWPWPLVLLAAAVVVSALDPWALLQPGFWLSFVAVGLLMGSSLMPAQPRGPVPQGSRWQRAGRAAAAGLRTQLVATVGLAPLTLVFFGQLSLVGLAANLVAIPVVTLLITPLALLGVAWAPLWGVAAAVERGLAAGLQALSAVPWAVWLAPVAPVWAQAAGLLGACLLVAPLPWRVRVVGLALAVPLFWPPLARPEPGRYEVMAVDVGQGTAVLVRTHRHLMVYDAGPQYSRESNAGQRVLLPLLQARGERRIDRLVLSHRDADHVGGAAALLTALPVGDLLSSLEPGHRLLALAPQATRCDAGQSWAWDGVQFEVLHPEAEAHGQAHKPNAMSCVLRVSGTQGRVLLTGDIEREQELRLVASGAPLQADVLWVAHHGSRTSSSAAFLDAVGAQVAVVQAGYRNRFGHPVPEVLARLQERGTLVVRSDACGAWQWDGHQTLAQARCERTVQRRYWQHSPHDSPSAGAP